LPNWGYAVTEFDPESSARTSGRDLPISPKAAREICAAIRWMSLTEAENFLEDVIKKKRPVAFKRHKKEVPHRRGLQGWYAGRYPVKAAREILKVLRSLKANAEDNDLDVEELKITHAATQRGMKVRGIIPRSFGRSSPYNQQLTHVELVASKV